MITLFLIAILATIGIYYILKIPVTLFNVVFGLVLLFLFGRGLVWKTAEEIRRDKDFIETIEEIKALI
jgi:hypothetical protein